MQINPYSIPPIISGTLTLFTGLFVLHKNPKSAVNWSFSLLCFGTTLWLSFYGINFQLSSSPENQEIINIIARISYCGVASLGITFFHYAIAVLDIPWAKLWNIANYIYWGILCVLIIGTDLIVSGLKLFFWGFYPQAGVLHPYFLAYFMFLGGLPLILLLQKIFSKHTDPPKRNQIKYITLALSIYYLACFDFIPNYGIEWYPFGYIPATLFITIVAYAIVKHNLMDIHIVIKKSFVYSILVSTITIIFLICVLISEYFFKNMFGYKGVLSSALAAFIIALIFNPLRDYIQRLMDRRLLKASPPEIAAENELLRKEVTQSEKHKAVAALASGIAHEVRNPLTAIKTFYEHFPQKKDDPEFLAKFTNITGKEIGRIEGLIQQLLDFAKPSPPSFRDTDINRLIEDTLELLAGQLKSHNIHLNCTLSPGPCTLNVDPNQIKQVLLNIFLNAIDAMPSGGELTVRTTSDERRFTISIADTGCGISPEDLKHIFDPFFSKKATGTGLGLAITQGIIEEHKGKIKVASEIGKGTEFTIELPIFI